MSSKAASPSAVTDMERPKRTWHVYRTTLISTNVVVCSTIGVYVLGVLAPFFTGELGIATSELGILTSSIFITAALVSIPAGQLADRSRVAAIAALQMVVSGVSVALLALVGSLFSIILVCVLMGLVTAMHGPLANRTVAGYVDSVQYKFVIGWRSLGPQIGSMLVGVIVAPFLQIASWRVVMAIVGVVIILTALPLYTGIRKGDALVRAASAAAEAEGRKPQAETATRGIPSVVLWLMAYTLFSSGAVVTIAAYLPSFAVEDFGMAIGQAGIAAGAVATASLIGRGIWIRLLSETNERLLMGLGTLSAAVSLTFLALTPLLGAPFFWIAAVLSGATALGTSPLGQIVLMRHCPPAYIGRASALTSMSMFGASIIMPLLFGLIAGIWGIASGWLVIAGSSLIASLVVWIWALRSRRLASNRAAYEEHVTDQDDDSQRA